MKPKKALGQNFLLHAQTAERIANASGISKDDTVLEIGPGTGKLTRALLLRAKRVIAIEADAELIPTLTETFKKEIAEGALTLIRGDVRTFDPASLQKSYHLVANIPYYITGEIIRQFLTTPRQPQSITVLVQKEVAERIARAKKESLLSLSVKAYGTPKYQFTVPRGAFFPAPSVDSAVLSIQNLSKKAFTDEKEEVHFFSVLHAGFAHKRKLLARNLESVASEEKIIAVFEEIGIPKKARAEDLSVSTWLLLSRALYAHKYL